ncbi:MAG: hypothetical protein ACLP5V_15120 [Candidatus Bathyarchaeia archaeon]
MASQINPALLRIEELVHRRSSSDRRMGYIWMIVPILPALAVVTIGTSLLGILVSVLPRISSFTQSQNAITPIVGEIFALYGLAIITFYVVLLFGALAFYYLIDRRNRHFGRQQLLFSTLHRYLAAKAPSSENMSRLGQLSEDSIYGERDRPAGLWAVLFLLVNPIVGLLAAYNLTKDLQKHDELQSNYQTTLSNAFSDAGVQPLTVSPYRFHKRDPFLFIILSAITAGLFWIYWFYTLLKDYNEHFSDQSKFEDQILNSLMPHETTKPCGTCGGDVPRNARFCPSCGRPQTN